MIVNGKLYTIFDEVEGKPLPEKEECAKQKKIFNYKESELNENKNSK